MAHYSCESVISEIHPTAMRTPSYDPLEEDDVSWNHSLSSLVPLFNAYIPIRFVSGFSPLVFQWISPCRSCTSWTKRNGDARELCMGTCRFLELVNRVTWGRFVHGRSEISMQIYEMDRLNVHGMYVYKILWIWMNCHLGVGESSIDQKKNQWWPPFLCRTKFAI
jgi:hypothetical protein